MKLTAVSGLLVSVLLACSTYHALADGNTLNAALIEGKFQDAECGLNDKPACYVKGGGFKCKGRKLAPRRDNAQSAICGPCGGHGQQCCEGLRCDPGHTPAGDGQVCIFTGFKRNPESARKRKNRLNRKKDMGQTQTIAAAAAVAPMTSDVVAGGPTPSPDVAPPPVVEPMVAAAEAASVDVPVDESSGMIYHPCRTEADWPGMPPCDLGTCMYGNGTPQQPGLCML